MKFYMLICLITGLTLLNSPASCKKSPERFPDGTKIPSWFSDTTRLKSPAKEKHYVVTSFGAVGDGVTLNTSALQKVIDMAAARGGGVIEIPEGRFLTGAIFFKPGTRLHVREGGVLLGSDEISNFPAGPSRMEGRSIEYFPAVVNAYGVDGFSITGKGAIDGNGLKYWQAFWKRRAENPACTNLEVSRPRLVFIRDSRNVRLEDVRLQNSGFWTTHLYKCSDIKILGLYIFSPASPVKAPSTDAIDLDVCSNVLIHGCYMSVNDDAIALKGGKGPRADTDTTNGANQNIIIQNCTFGFCHSAVTCGSEAIHNRNIIFRNCRVDGPDRVLWLKMRPDTPQLYEYITVEKITGEAVRMVYAKPWTQFFDLQGKPAPPPSVCRHISFRDITLKCSIFADLDKSPAYRMEDFTFTNLRISAKNGILKKEWINGIRLENTEVNGQLLQ